MNKNMPTYGCEPSWQREHNTQKKIVSGDPLAVIYNEGAWRLYKVSPLYNLQYESVKIKQYASKIRQALVSAVPTSASVKYSVRFEVQPSLKYCEEDPDALIVTVTSSPETNNNNSKVVYTAILLSWGVRTDMENAIHLTYMLERGEQKIGTVVKTTLQTAFDCIIRSFHFSQHHLLYFGFNFLESGSPRSNDPFTLLYKTPQANLKDKLKLSFASGDIQYIWNGVKEEISRSTEQVNLAYQLLQNQIFLMIKLDITVHDLCEIILPKAEIKDSGVVKMKTPEIVNCVFTLLNEISGDIQVTSDESVGSHNSSN